MAYSLREVKRMCVKNGSTIAELKEVLEKMETCPEIGNYVEPILVESITCRLKAFIAGDKYGKPRFFAYEKREGEGDKDVYKKMAKSRFKKYGLLHSLSKEELKVWYMETLPNKIFADKDLEIVENYDDYERKDYFLRNYYIQRIPYETAFHIYHNETEEKEFKKKIKGMFYNHISFCYVEPKYKEFCKTQAELLGKLESAKEAASNGSFEYWKDAFLSEMFNHEYGIAWDADYNVISCFASIGYNNITLEQCFDDAGFTEVQRAAYRAARDKYYETATF
jgi:hypothetical protein